MGLSENFRFYTSGFKNMKVLTDQNSLPSNSGGICGGLALTWLKSRSGTLKTGEGLRTPLFTLEETASSVHHCDLDGGKNRELAGKSSEVISLVGTNDPGGLRDKTPWGGAYKIYEIASSKGHGHFMGAYFPWIGDPQFYDPNLVHCEIEKSSFFDLISKWPKIYDNQGGAQWGFEYLYVIKSSEV